MFQSVPPQPANQSEVDTVGRGQQPVPESERIILRRVEFRNSTSCLIACIPIASNAELHNEPTYRGREVHQGLGRDHSLWFWTTRRHTEAISVKRIIPLRKSSTAASLAAFNTAPDVPPALATSKASAKAG